MKANLKQKFVAVKRKTKKGVKYVDFKPELVGERNVGLNRAGIRKALTARPAAVPLYRQRIAAKRANKLSMMKQKSKGFIARVLGK